ncbi:hypothetical protein DL770_010223 [Monosporascus sp. CRB-9-2]|nr:hypothetical protein DL770_010223 [Monosporascus sp. CRB-9-2]
MRISSHHVFYPVIITSHNHQDRDPPETQTLHHLGGGLSAEDAERPQGNLHPRSTASRRNFSNGRDHTPSVTHQPLELASPAHMRCPRRNVRPPDSGNHPDYLPTYTAHPDCPPVYPVVVQQHRVRAIMSERERQKKDDGDLGSSAGRASRTRFVRVMQLLSGLSDDRSVWLSWNVRNVSALGWLAWLTSAVSETRVVAARVVGHIYPFRLSTPPGSQPPYHLRVWSGLVISSCRQRTKLARTRTRRMT